MTNIINKMDKSNMQCIPLNLDLGQGLSVPRDLALIIFQNSKANLHNMSEVSKNWKAFADDKEFRQMIRPNQAFGTQEWKEYIGVDAGEELPLPRWAYGFMEEGKYMLTFIPKIVKVAKENGVIENVALDNLEVIGNLVANPKNGNKIGFSHGDWNSWQEAIKEKRKLEESHWALIGKEVMGRDLNYTDQQALAKKERVSISGLIDTVTSVFVEYVRSGKRNFIFDPPVNGQRTWVRVNDQTRNIRIGLGFVPSGLRVDCYYDDDADDHIAFAPGRKSIVH